MIFFLPILIGFIFEILASPYFGFYLIPALILVSVFAALPFVFPWLNILIAFLSSFLFVFVWSVWKLEMHWPSYSYAFHILLYLAVIAFSIIIVYFTQKK